MTPGEIYDRAHTAGCKAFAECVPTPVKFGQAKGLTGSEMVPGTESIEPEGLCGWAGIVVKPARGPFITFCKANGHGSKHVYPGWILPCRGEFDSQSIERKEAYADAFIAVLQDNGIRAYKTSRLL